MQCTVPCEVDTYEGFEPLSLGNHLLGGVVEGLVCTSDPTDDFELEVAGPAFVSLYLYADRKPGAVNLALVEAGNFVVAESATSSSHEAISVRLVAAGTYRVRVSWQSGPAGVPFRLAYRTLLQ